MYSYIMHFRDNCRDAKDDRITFVTFEQWEIMYEADPSNWQIEIRNEYIENNIFNILFEDAYIEGKYFRIYYKYPNNEDKHYIKFLRRKDHRKFCKFYKNMIKSGIDYQNQQELLKLGETVNKEAKKRLEEAQKKLNEAYNNNIKLIEKISKN